MKEMIIRPIERLYGEVAMPGDKSISHRAIMLGALAKGPTRVKGLLDCDDCNHTIRAFREMGVLIEPEDGVTLIEGRGLGGLSKPKGPIHVGNSGTTMRILAGVLAGQDFDVTLTCDESLLARPMKRVVEPLSAMGVDIKAMKDEYPPLKIRGGAVKPIDYKMTVPSAQIKSAILFAGLYANGMTTVEERYKSRDHTERMMRSFGANIDEQGLKVLLDGGKELEPQEIRIPGDISSASFFMVGAAIIKGSRIIIKDVGLNPTRAGMIEVMSRMGANIKVLSEREGDGEPAGDVAVEYGRTKGIVIEEDSIPSIIDELPVIFVLAALSEGKTVVKGAKELRVKETDRINSMIENLKAMGARICLEGEDIVIDGVDKLKGASLKSFGDHRTCMAMAIAALSAKGESSIDDIGCVAKSFPEFFDVLKMIGS